MNRGWRHDLKSTFERVVGAALLGWFVSMPPAFCQTAGASFESGIRPVLAKYCYACHSEKLASGNLNLEALQDGGLALKEMRVWERVYEKLSSGMMPPAGMPAPTKTEIAAVTSWIDRTMNRPSREADPGRVTARRLNRVEYNNTVRDLLGVSLRPADEFPVDDSGYGFDNIGDVLSVSPLLMEKYMTAAKRL